MQGNIPIHVLILLFSLGIRGKFLNPEFLYGFLSYSKTDNLGGWLTCNFYIILQLGNVFCCFLQYLKLFKILCVIYPLYRLWLVFYIWSHRVWNCVNCGNRSIGSLAYFCLLVESESLRYTSSKLFFRTPRSRGILRVAPYLQLDEIAAWSIKIIKMGLPTN